MPNTIGHLHHICGNWAWGESGGVYDPLGRVHLKIGARGLTMSRCGVGGGGGTWRGGMGYVVYILFICTLPKLC